MKAADALAARLAGNMMESMGAASAGAPIPPPNAMLHGGAAKYRGASRLKDALSIRLDEITPDPNQPRKEFDPAELNDLAESLKARGQLQPVRVRWDDAMGRWILIAGERRYRAALLAGLTSLVCIDSARPQSDEDILEDQLVENCLRSDLRPVEQARAFRLLMDRRGWSYRQLGATLHLSSAHITRSMALLSLPEDLQEQVDAGTIPASAAAEVAKVEDDGARREIVGKIASGELTRDETVKAVRQANGSKGRGGKPAPRKTEGSVRTSAGKVTVENRKGVDDEVMLAAMLEGVEMIRARRAGRTEAA
jgi:ParB family chromosome partitioning protein